MFRFILALVAIVALGIVFESPAVAHGPYSGVSVRVGGFGGVRAYSSGYYAPASFGVQSYGVRSFGLRSCGAQSLGFGVQSYGYVPLTFTTFADPCSVPVVTSYGYRSRVLVVFP